MDRPLPPSTATPPGASGSDRLTAAPRGMGQADAGHAALPPETDLWTGRTHLFYFAGRVLLWVILNLGLGVLLISLRGRFDWLTTRRSLYAFLVFLALSTLLMLVPVVWRLLQNFYRISTQRLFIERGVLSRTVDQTELIRVDDVRTYQSFFDRLLGIGTVTLLTTDATDRQVRIEGVKDPDRISEIIRGQMRTLRGKSLFVENI